MAEPKRSPPVSVVRASDTHRLIAFRRGDSVLSRIADSQAHLQDIFELDAATNDRLVAENDMFAGIDVRELVFGVPYYRIVNAAFTHPHPLGSRFSSPERSAWYCAIELQTAQAEVAHHKAIALAEIDTFNDETSYVDYLADFDGHFHDLRNDARFSKYLDPNSYVQSQQLGEALLGDGSLGVIHPSVCQPHGTCIACFRPALVMNVRKDSAYRFTWDGTPTPVIVKTTIA